MLTFKMNLNWSESWVGSVSYYSSVVFCPVSYFLTVSYYFWNFCRKYDTGLVGYRINTKMVIRHCRINTILEYTAIVFFKKKFGDSSIVFIGRCRIFIKAGPVSYFSKKCVRYRINRPVSYFLKHWSVSYFSKNGIIKVSVISIN